MKPTNPKRTITEEMERSANREEGEALVVQLLIKSGLFLQREFNQVCQQHGLNANQFSAIHEVIRQGPISQKELCERLLFEKSNVSKIVRNLQDKGLISVTVAPNDRRSTLLMETKQGFEIWQDCLHAFRESSTELMSDLFGDELHSLTRLMKRLERRFMRLAEKQGR